ncbi:PGF-CTERM protein [Halogranum rubrum]|uniref:PGF-CTERM protein n=1 Tax=Halogranum rubrum TaxID=553466 RepID=A0A1I4IL22_9EURY|nr:PGF-CTERM sorting domain-containing protein [Halogranum rubrum]SFL54994.1 PGF-CTERM protein [Halogranum rubrum]
MTVDGDASDDLATDVPFVLAQGNLRLTDVVPNGNRQASGVRPIAAGETMLVRGLTNRQPSGVLVEVTVEGPNETLGPVAAEDWETDGVWTATLDVPSDATPGTYTVIADDGEQSADVDVEVVAQRAEPTASETTGAAEDGESPTATATATPTPASTQSTTDPTPEPTPEPSPEPTTTETQSPGFGPLVGLAGLFGLLVLARVVRRQ